MSQQLNFAELKQRISIVQGAEYLGLQLTKDGDSFRCECPVHKGGERSLSILPSKNTFKCFQTGNYGSVIDLVCHVKQIGLKEAGQWLNNQETKQWEEDYDGAEQKEETPARVVDLKPLGKLPKLNNYSEEVKATGLDPQVAEIVGVGWSAVGLLKGHIGVPLFDEQGQCVGYLGIPKGTQLKLPRNLQFQESI